MPARPASAVPQCFQIFFTLIRTESMCPNCTVLVQICWLITYSMLVKAWHALWGFVAAVSHVYVCYTPLCNGH